jgi:alkylhydroperoxidase/carboxymuconolactone decarboxylase family protein YurZ
MTYCAGVPQRKDTSDALEQLRSRIFDGPGQLDGSLRQAAFLDDVASLSGPMGSYVDKVHHHAYDMTDEDTQGLLDAGMSEDQIFELTVAAALGAGMSRFERARAAQSESDQ